MKKVWSFLLNVFLNVTDNSFRLALRITLFHYSTLKANVSDAFIASLYSTYEGIHKNFVDAYNAWRVQLGIQQGATKALDAMFAELSSDKISKWKGAVTGIYGKDSSIAIALFPQQSKPFQHGSQSDRLEAVNQLIMAIGSNPDLAALKAEIELFYTSLNDTFEAQKGAKNITDNLIDAVEAARVTMCIAQYANLGAMMQHYAETPLISGNYFDQKAIRTGTQIVFMGLIKPLLMKTIVQRTLQPTDVLKLENDGNTELRFYLAASKDAAIGATFISVAANSITTVNASDLGDVSTQHYLMVYNPDTLIKGEFTVEFE
jgi:hypothetical protein